MRRSAFATLIVIGAMLVTWPGMSQEIHSAECLKGCPFGSPATNDLIIREIYILSSNDQTKFADWVGYRVRREAIGSTKSRIWKQDPYLSNDETLEPSDYRDANAVLQTDRGHQAPLASFTSTDFWKSTNFLSNITPQKADLNQGAWVRLESAVRDLARGDEVGTVFVMTGPLYEEAQPILPGTSKSHMVPSGYWKIISIPVGASLRTAGFIFRQTLPRATNICDQVVPIGEIEHRSKLSFFNELSADDKEVILDTQQTLHFELGC